MIYAFFTRPIYTESHLIKGTESELSKHGALDIRGPHNSAIMLLNGDIRQLMPLEMALEVIKRDALVRGIISAASSQYCVSTLESAIELLKGD
jgi:hypothetical protein